MQVFSASQGNLPCSTHDQRNRRWDRVPGILSFLDTGRSAEEEALRTGLSLGMTLIDTAEIYGDGRSEKLIGRVIAGQRDRVFLVSKVWPTHVTGNGIARACDASLARLGTDHLDLYLLHWPSRDADLSSIVAAFETLRAAGKIHA
jgi:diketogulonate reductase-like aldo/keto reductase